MDVRRGGGCQHRDAVSAEGLGRGEATGVICESGYLPTSVRKDNGLRKTGLVGLQLTANVKTEEGCLSVAVTSVALESLLLNPLTGITARLAFGGSRRHGSREVGAKAPWITRAVCW